MRSATVKKKEENYTIKNGHIGYWKFPNDVYAVPSVDILNSKWLVFFSS